MDIWIPKMERITDRIEIHHGDCYELLDGWPSDAALVTDPPYGIAYRHSGVNIRPIPGRKTQPRVMARKMIHGDNKDFDPRPFLRFATVCLWGANHFADKLPTAASWLVWDKRDNRGQERSFGDGEIAWCNVGRSVRIFRYLWQGICQAGEKGKKLHPNQKPIALMEWVLKKAKVGKDTLVIDPFMGSGSLGVACHRSGLRYLGVEIDPEHYATARERLKRETAQGLLCMPNAPAHLPPVVGKSDSKGNEHE